jgi:hypothetical protein
MIECQAARVKRPATEPELVPDRNPTRYRNAFEQPEILNQFCGLL